MLGVTGDLRGHEVAGVRGAVEGAGCRLLDPPPDRPDLGPVEMASSKLKGLLRRAAERLRAALGRLAGAVTPADAQADTRHAGYAATPARSLL